MIGTYQQKKRGERNMLTPTAMHTSESYQKFYFEYLPRIKEEASKLTIRIHKEMKKDGEEEEES